MTKNPFRSLFYRLFSTLQRPLTQLSSQPPPYTHKKSQPAAVVTRREQQEATTHCGSELKITYFDFNERSYSIIL